MNGSTPDLDRRPTPAGVYDAALGGTANTAADRELVERARVVMPHVIHGAWANRGFLQRAVTRMAADWGVRQFLDLGSGMPTQRNTHEVAGEVCPGARVVYVDNDPSVISTAARVLRGVASTAAVLADIRDPRAILEHPDTRRLLDPGRPVGLLIIGVTHFLPDEDDPWGLVAAYVDALPSGSYLALSAVTSDRQEEAWDRVLSDGHGRGYDGYARGKGDIERFFAGLEIIPPYRGAPPEVAHIGMWGAEDPDLADDDSSRLAYAAVARKP